MKLGTIDERAVRTRNKIADAIIALGKQQPIDSIRVGALCAKAGISRSTFYQHYDSLRGYLTTAYANMLEYGTMHGARAPGGAAQPLPIGGILEHIGKAGAYGVAVMASTHYPAMIAAGEERLTRVTAGNLKRLAPELDETERHAVATFIAGGFMATLRRWRISKMREPAEVVQARFQSFCRALVASAVLAAGATPPTR